MPRSEPSSATWWSDLQHGTGSAAGLDARLRQVLRVATQGVAEESVRLERERSLVAERVEQERRAAANRRAREAAQREEDQRRQAERVRRADEQAEQRRVRDLEERMRRVRARRPGSTVGYDEARRILRADRARSDSVDGGASIAVLWQQRVAVRSRIRTITLVCLVVLAAEIGVWCWSPGAGFLLAMPLAIIAFASPIWLEWFLLSPPPAPAAPDEVTDRSWHVVYLERRAGIDSRTDPPLR